MTAAVVCIFARPRAKLRAMIATRAAATALLVFTVGCSSSDGATPANADGAIDTRSSPDASSQTTDISGWYQVTADVEGACGATMPSTLGSPYLWVEHQGSRYVVRACNGTTASDCTGTYFNDFTQPIENGWSA